MESYTTSEGTVVKVYNEYTLEIFLVVNQEDEDLATLAKAKSLKQREVLEFCKCSAETRPIGEIGCDDGISSLDTVDAFNDRTVRCR